MMRERNHRERCRIPSLGLHKCGGGMAHVVGEDCLVGAWDLAR